MRPPPRADHRVDFIDDHRPDRPQHVAAAVRRQQQVERLGRRHEDVRRLAEHRRSLSLCRIACPDGRGDLRRRKSVVAGKREDLSARLGEILVDVGAQRFERRDIQDADLIRKRRGQSLSRQLIEGRQECGERLSRSSRRSNQRVPAVQDRFPALRLRGRRLTDRARKPLLDDGMEAGQGHYQKKNSIRRDAGSGFRFTVHGSRTSEL